MHHNDYFLFVFTLQKLGTVCMAPEHPFELPEGLGKVLQLVVKVDVFLDQSMNRILKLEAHSLHDQKGQRCEEEQWLQPPHCGRGSRTKITSSDTGTSRRCVWIPFEKEKRCTAGMQEHFAQIGGEVTTLGRFFPKPWVESCQRAALKSIHCFHTSSHNDQSSRLLLFNLLRIFKYCYTCWANTPKVEFHKDL